MENDIEPFYIGYAYEALSRSALLIGKTDLSHKYYRFAMDFAQKVHDDNSKEMLVMDIETIK
ncbi:hypothetical protein V7087_22420 [Neobacillus niacini]|uniref:hypothetical protein n=1 Tax=Neobacillus niacini TaxID=86668 RepID=UPI002FFDF2EA